MLFLAGCSAGGGGDADAPQPANEKESASSNSSDKETDESPDTEKLEHPSLGDADAPVVMTEYSDYQ